MTDKTHTQVMVVDDDLDVPRAVDLCLQDFGYVISGFSNPMDAFTAAITGKFAVAIVDLKLGAFSGLSLMKDFRREVPEMSVVILTGNPSTDSAVDSVNHDAFRYILKPFGLKELKSCVDDAVAAAAQNKRVLFGDVDRFLTTSGLSLNEAAAIRELYRGSGVSDAARNLSSSRTHIYRCLETAFSTFGVSTKEQLFEIIRRETQRRTTR